MKIEVKVRPNAGREFVEKCEDGTYKVWVRETPQKGSANKAVLKALAGELGVAPARLRVVTGSTSSRKIIEVK